MTQNKSIQPQTGTTIAKTTPRMFPRVGLVKTAVTRTKISVTQFTIGMRSNRI